MKRVFDNARILYGEGFEEVEGYVIVKDDVIEEVGEGSYIGPKVDMKRGIISPSFTNTHVHLGDSAGMDMGANLPIGERVGKKGIKYNIHLKDNVKTAISASLTAMKLSGTTAFCDFREGGVEGIALLKSVLNMPAKILGRPGNGDDFMEHCDGVGISSITDYTEEELENILKKRNGKIVGIHAGECRDDVLEALKTNPDFLVHLTNAGPDSLKTVFKKKLPLVLCPRANASFAVGIPDLNSILNSPCLVALGTDNVMANSTNMFRELEFLYKFYRGLYKDPSFDARIVLRAATINGRKLLNLPSNSIEEGNVADFIVTRALEFAHDAVLALVHRIEVEDIKEVVTPSLPFLDQ